MKISVSRTAAVAFEATNDEGVITRIDGPPAMGGQGQGFRPMQLVLTGLASCAAMDVVHILNKQGEPLKELIIDAEAERADAVPAVFTRAELCFVAGGGVNAGKLRRAVKLAVEKYCSVAAMLPAVVITHRVFVLEADGSRTDVTDEG